LKIQNAWKGREILGNNMNNNFLSSMINQIVDNRCMMEKY